MLNPQTLESAVFCAVMGAADCADAAERLLRLPLKVPSTDPKTLQTWNFPAQPAASRLQHGATPHRVVVPCVLVSRLGRGFCRFPFEVKVTSHLASVFVCPFMQIIGCCSPGCGAL